LTKEEIYDSEILPVLRLLVMVAQHHDIAMIADFDIGEAPDTLHSFTHVPAKTGSPRSHLKAKDAIYPAEPVTRVVPRPGSDNESVTIL
jgi:hypothetical protein